MNIQSKKFKRSANYVPIGRNLLVVDKLKKKDRKKECVSYAKDITSVSYVVSRRGAIPDKIVEGESVAIPFYDIACNPQRRYDQNISMRELLEKSASAIYKTEDWEILSCLYFAATPNQTLQTEESLNLQSFAWAFSRIKSHNIEPKVIVVHPQEAELIRLLDKESFKPSSKRKYRATKCMGKLMGVKVYETNRNLQGTVLVMAAPEYVGVLTERQKLKSKFYDNPKELRKGFVLWESIGIFIINDYAVAKIEFNFVPLLNKQPSFVDPPEEPVKPVVQPEKKPAAKSKSKSKLKSKTNKGK